MKCTFRESDNAAKRLTCIGRLRKISVAAGLLPDAPERSRRLLRIHERGSPIMHIPPRPVVGPALAKESVREAVTEALMTSCEAAFRGDESGITDGFEEAGKAAVRGIREQIDGGISPGNAPVTVSGGWVYNRVAKTGAPVEGKGFDKPMVDSGQLYESFDYEVKT